MAKPRPPAPLWRYFGQERPAFADKTAPGEESVWDYPRPPRIVPDAREIIVRVGDQILAQTSRAIRILETASPPTFYLPPEDVASEWLVAVAGTSHCEWKGAAQYFDWQGPEASAAPPRIGQLAWCYPDPYAEFEDYTGWFGFYPGRGAVCSVDGEIVRPQPGHFYAGWITNEIKGPVKGDPGSQGW